MTVSQSGVSGTFEDECGVAAGGFGGSVSVEMGRQVELSGEAHGTARATEFVARSTGLWGTVTDIITGVLY